jgi:PilZ domain-containing protein
MKDRESIGTADQRRSDRKALEAPVTMRVETSTLSGQSDNVSRAGMLFFTDQPLRVTLEVAEPGGTRTYRGRLIRLQRMSESSTGLAVEFDPE